MKAELNCIEFETKIHELLDQRVPLEAAQELLAHSQDCRFCAQTLNEYQSFFRVIVSSDVQTCQDPTTIYQRLDSTSPFPSSNPNPFLKPPASKSRRLKKYAWGFGPSFAALLMVGIGMWLVPHHPPANSQLANIAFAASQPVSAPNLREPGLTAPFQISNQRDFYCEKSNNIFGVAEGYSANMSHLPIDHFPADPPNNNPWDLLWNNCNASSISILEFTENYQNLPQQLQQRTFAFWQPQPFDYLTTKLEPWQPVLDNTPEFWGIHTAKNSILLTLNWLQKSIMKSQPRSRSQPPDLGAMPDSIWAVLA